MYIIQKVQILGKSYVYGNKTYTTSLFHARQFDTLEEAENHIENWFGKGTHVVRDVKSCN